MNKLTKAFLIIWMVLAILCTITVFTPACLLGSIINGIFGFYNLIVSAAIIVLLRNDKKNYGV